MPQAPFPDELLFARLKKGDEEVFSMIYDRFAANLIAYAGARLFRLEDARDLIQDVFLKLWHDRLTLQIHTGLSNYLYTATRNRVIDHIRRNAIREEYGLLLQHLGKNEAADAQQLLAAKELALRVQQALNALTPKVREVYRLSREQHLSIPEIAAQLNVSEQTVKNQLTTALNHLRKSLVLPAFILLSSTFWWLS
ncbi:MAG: RNA polymerase sigma-70 factor [Sphingobacteriales bacterium]